MNEWMNHENPYIPLTIVGAGVLASLSVIWVCWYALRALVRLATGI